MDGMQADQRANRSWADVARNSGQPTEATSPNNNSASGLLGNSQQSSPTHSRATAAAQHPDLRTAHPHRRMPTTEWGVANASILSDPHPDDHDPFAGFPLEYLTLKSDYTIRSTPDTDILEQTVPVFSAAHPDFTAVHHLCCVLDKTLNQSPDTALRYTLTLKPREYLVIPLDKALKDLDGETVTRARFSFQHLTTVAEHQQYPLRFSLEGKVQAPGSIAHQLTARKVAKEKLNGFWMTFAHYAEAANLPDKENTIQTEITPLLNKYLDFANKPALQDAMRDLAQFFQAVFQTADFKDVPHRPILLQRMTDILKAAVSDAFLLETLGQEARENMTNCADRRALVLGDMEMAVLLYRSHDENSTKGLFDAGLSLMKVHIADRHAFNAANHNQEDETIEVLLRFRTALADEGLAISGQHMAHQTVAQVNDIQIDEAAAEIEQSTRDLRQVQDFFRHCTPWLEHVESLGSPALTELSEQSQADMAELHDKRQNMPEYTYKKACDNLMTKWQAEKSALLAVASDHLVASLHQEYWHTTG